MKDVLLIFLREPVLGKVKTRLAATVGDQRALSIYKQLIDHTFQVAAPLECTMETWYADGIPADPPCSPFGFIPKQQRGDDLGERMSHAFRTAFDSGADRTVVIGTDCPGITMEILDEAFGALETNDVVIGPARDGGYYLLGMRTFIPELFVGKEWSTSTVRIDTISDLERSDLSFMLLPELNDVDTEDDLT